ncbi:MAG: hypothetical protein AAGJ80_20850, partial [Cyanobacteria bacterium J06553_1]
MASSSLRGTYFTPGTLKACLVALVKPVAYLKYLVNPVTEPGLIAYFAPNTERRIDAADGSKDGPGAGEAVYLTSSPPEQSADGK